jgi:hypothetical protein
MPRNRVGVQTYVGGGKAAEVWSSSKAWPCIFPQHGPGPKHLRSVQLTSWQAEIVSQNPRELIRGLIHSDGCRVINRSNGRCYTRYLFTNASSDIREIFCTACDQLEIAWRQPNDRVISIAKRDSVELMDTFVGAKA